MPEGPQAHRAGNLIAKRTGAMITDIIHPPSRKPWGLGLPDRLDRVEVVGKNIFIHLRSGAIIYNHMLMWGSWRLSTEVFGKKRLNTAFETDKGPIGYYGGGILKLVSRAEADEIQSRIGPELVSSQTAEDAFQQVRSSKLPVGEAVLQQSLISGIGNIYKSEGLFVARIHPLKRACDVAESAYARMFEFLQPKMIADVKHTGPITTTTTAAARAGTRNFVYRRWHQPCLWCGTKIERIYQGTGKGRSTYFCPRCQAVS